MKVVLGSLLLGLSACASPVRPEPGRPESARPAQDVSREEALLAELAALRRTQGDPSLVARPAKESLRSAYGYLLLGRPNAALQGLKFQQRQQPAEPLVLTALGRAYLATGKPAEAEPLLRQAMQGQQQGGSLVSADLPRLHASCLLQTGAVEKGVGILRQELATGRRPAEAALVLVDIFRQQERLVEALACVRAGLQRQPQRPDLRLQEAMLCNDLLRPSQAVQILTNLTGAWPGQALALEALALEELAFAYRMQGEYQRALDCLAQLTEGQLPLQYRSEEQDMILALQQELQQELGQNRRLDLRPWRELMALLRAAQDSSDRVAALHALLQGPVELAEDAINLASQDADSQLRKHALRFALARGQAPMSVLRQALTDDDPGVRGLAATLACQPNLRSAVDLPGLLLEFIALEQHPTAFRKMHAALETVHHTTMPLPPQAENQVDQRRRIVLAWEARR